MQAAVARITALKRNITEYNGGSGAGIGKQPFAVSARIYIGTRAPVTHPPYLSVFIRFRPFCSVVLLSVARVCVSVSDLFVYFVYFVV